MKKTLLTSYLTAGAVLPAQGTTILQYDTAPSNENAMIAASFAAPGITADDLTAGAGIDAASGSTWNWNNWDPASTTAADAIAAGETWTWGFDVTGQGTSITLNSFDIRLDRSGTGPDDFDISVSVNGGSSTSVLTHDYADSDSGVDFISASLAAVPQLTTGDSVVFTLAAFNSEGTSGTFDLETVEFNGADPRSLRIEGTVVIPEPSTYGVLSGLVVLCVVAFRRRR